jgi:hypothetical protein
MDIFNSVLQRANKIFKFWQHNVCYVSPGSNIITTEWRKILTSDLRQICRYCSKDPSLFVR